MKNVLIITYIFPPMAGSGVQRTLKFIKHLPQFGWQPEVVTIKPYVWNMSDSDMIGEVPKSVGVHRCHSLEIRRLPASLRSIFDLHTISRVRHLFEVPDHCIGWLPFALLAAKDIMCTKRIDLLYSTSPPCTTHLIAYAIKKKYRIPWVADFRDPWTHHPRFEFRVPRVYRKLVRRLETAVVNYADKIVMGTETIATDLIMTYGDVVHSKIAFVSHGFDEADFSGANKCLPENQHCFKIVYTGDIELMGEGIRPLLYAFRRCVKDRAIETRSWQLQLVGESGEHVAQWISELKLGNRIQLPGYVSHKEAIAYTLGADVLVAYSWGRNIIPAKVFEYLRAKKPILALSMEGDALTRLIQDSGAGIVVPLDDEDLIAEALWDIYKGVIEGNGKLQASEKFIAQFERKKLTEKLSKAFCESMEKAHGI